jgi:hypothetical protein
MDIRDLLRQQFAGAHSLLETVVADVDKKALTYSVPNSTISNIGTIYVHVVVGEDFLINGLAMGRPPVFNAEWSAKTGIPQFERPNVERLDISNINLDAFREYANAVFASTDAGIANLTDEQAQKPVQFPGPPTNTLQFIANIGLSHMSGHCGELSALKGIQGLKGLPF